MRQRMISALAAVGLLTAIVAGPALAGPGGVDRYQVATTSYTIAVLDTFMHTFVVAVSPCDGSIAITGSTPIDSGYYTTETVTGTLTSGVISFSSTYDGPYNPGFMWTGSFPVAGGPLSGQYTGTVTAAPTTLSTYKNHGDFVSSMGGGPDAAHSCIGKPIKTKDHALSAVGPDGADADEANDEANDTAKDHAKVEANDEANDEATDKATDEAKNKANNKKHVNEIKRGGSAPEHGAHASNRPDHPKHPKHHHKPAAVKNHPNNGNHSGRP